MGGGGGGAGGLQPKKPNAASNFKFGTDFFGFFPGFFFVFPFWQIFTGLTGSCSVVLVGYNSSY